MKKQNKHKTTLFKTQVEHSSKFKKRNNEISKVALTFNTLKLQERNVSRRLDQFYQVIDHNAQYFNVISNYLKLINLYFYLKTSNDLVPNKSEA